jgi:glycosyltransferase involved in cell wall biosynthesis
VHEGTLWLAAFFLARKLHVPLHLILHDDWFREYGEAWLRRRLQKEFGVIYRATASRFCVSPYMEEEFNRSFGARGDVLYPSRSPALDTSPDGATRLPAMRPFTVAYGGSTFDGGYGEGLRLMAKALALRGGKLLIFGPLSQADAQLIGLGGLNVQCCGLVSASELITRFRNEADALFVPMSFHEADRPNMSLSFPSKLADYTAAGLPLLISGPSYCSAVRWTKDNPGCAEIVEEQNLDSLGLALDRLMSDEDYRSRMGAEAGRVGSRYFSPDTARQLFMQRLVGA